MLGLSLSHASAGGVSLSLLYLAMAIPTLDLRLAESDRREAARQLVVALEDPGFLYLQNVKGYQPGETASVVAITIPSNRAAARSPRIDEYNTDHCFYSTQNLHTAHAYTYIVPKPTWVPWPLATCIGVVHVLVSFPAPSRAKEGSGVCVYIRVY